MKKKPKEKLDHTFEFLKAFLEVQFENYIALHDFMETHISSVQKEIDEKYDEVDKIEDKLEWNVAMEQLELELESDLFRFEHEFPNRIRYSAIVQTYSMLEVYLKWLCNNLQRINNLPFGIADLKGSNDLDKGKLYIKKIYNLDFNKLNPEWSFLSNMRKIRNQIIHNNGDFTVKDKEIIEIINKNENLGIMWEEIHPKLEANKVYEIKIVSKKLNKEFIETVLLFFEKLVAEIKNNEIHTA
ncbi:hypothetical protein AB9K26_00105 [Psychroserpens sp. XS_ASV72]|uniref:hypothetical protein n=1 Tax=Psychroserpens sp. XS_ASV72 TaxID=3241293 RepID=UPI003512531A